MNTRKYPRTMNEAFPRGTEYAASIERTRRADWSGRLIIVICAGLIATPWLVLAVLP